MKRLLLVLALATLALPGVAQAADPVAICNAPMTMSDGVVLRANVFLPKATGRFPVVLTITGYNKDTNNPFGSSCSSDSALNSGNTKLLDKGIAIMIVDDRGTGASGGRWDSWGAGTQPGFGDVPAWVPAHKRRH